MVYNPFAKGINELADSDLDRLVSDQVAEGYWIEYKSTLPSSRAVAKSIASFANTYGGWFFAGVIADPHTNAATCIQGFDLGEVREPIAAVRDAIRSHIDPVPVFHLRLIELTTGRGVLVAYIPSSQETPFVTKDGRIYRRVGDSSDPIHETNRYAIDRLVDNGREVSRQFQAFCRDERTFSKAEEDTPWVELYLSPYPWGSLEMPQEWGTCSHLDALLQLSGTLQTLPLRDGAHFGTGNVPFDTAQVSADSILLRQAGQRSFAFNTLTAQLFDDGRARFFMQLPGERTLPPDAIVRLNSGTARAVLAGLHSRDLEVLRFFDVGTTWMAIALLASFYQAWLHQDFPTNSPDLANLRGAIRLSGVWRLVPFHDSEAWGQYVQRFGLPITLQDTIELPRNIARGLPLTLRGEPLLWLELSVNMCLALGLPADLLIQTATSGSAGTPTVGTTQSPPG